MPTSPSQLQQELKQSRPFASSAQEAVLGVLRTADLLRRGIAEILEPLGVSPQQFNVLRILRGAGARGLPTLEIAARMIEHSPGITRLVDRLISHGWADRVRCTDDRRVVYCRITEAGLDLLAKADDPRLREAEASLIPLPEADLQTLIGLLDRVRAGEDKQ